MGISVVHPRRGGTGLGLLGVGQPRLGSVTDPGLAAAVRRDFFAADLTDAAAYPSDFSIMTGGSLPQPNHEAIISLHQVRLRAIVAAH